MQEIQPQLIYHTPDSREQVIPESDKTDRKNKRAHISGWDVSTIKTERKRCRSSHEQSDLEVPDNVLKKRRVSNPPKSKANILHQRIYVDLTKVARGGLGKEIFGDFWDAFRSIIDIFPHKVEIVDEEQLISVWATSGSTRDCKSLTCTWDNNRHKIASINYLWDQVKNILLRGLKDEKKYFNYPTEYKQGRNNLMAWECLNAFLEQHIRTKGWKVTVEEFRLTLINSLKDPSPTSDDRKKLTIQHCCQFPDHKIIDKRATQLFTEAGWKEILKHIHTSHRQHQNVLSQSIPEVNDIISNALKDFLRIMPEMPDGIEDDDIHPETNNPIRRTVASSEFNISSAANKLNSEHTFATLIYPIIHSKKYWLTAEDIDKYLFLLSAVMVLNEYHFIIMAETPQKESLANKQLWINEHKYHSIFPFLLTFIPGESSLASGADEYIGENINYQTLLRCFDLNEIVDEIVQENNPELSLSPDPDPDPDPDPEINLKPQSKKKTKKLDSVRINELTVKIKISEKEDYARKSEENKKLREKIKELETKLELEGDNLTSVIAEKTKFSVQIAEQEEALATLRIMQHNSDEKLKLLTEELCEERIKLVKREEDFASRTLLMEENSRLTKQVEDSQNRIKEAERDARAHTENSTALQDRIDTLEKEFKNLQEEINTKTMEIESYEKSKILLEKSLKEAQENLQQSEEKKEEIEQLHLLLDRAKTVIQESREEIESLESSLSNTQKEITELDKRLKAKEDENKSLNKDLKGSEEEVLIIKDVLLDTETQKQMHDKKLKKTHEKMLKEKNTELARLKLEYQSKLSSAEIKIENMQDKERNHQDDFDKLEQDLKTAQEKTASKPNDGYLRRLINKKAKVINDLEEKLKSSECQTIEEQKRSEHLKSKIEVLEKELGLLCGLLREKEKESEQSLTNLQRDLDAAKKQINREEKILEDIRLQKSLLLNEKSELELELNSVKMVLDSIQRQELIWHDQKENALKTIETLKHDKHCLKKELKTIQEKDKVLLEEMLESSNSDLINARSQIIENDQELQRIKKIQDTDTSYLLKKCW